MSLPTGDTSTWTEYTQVFITHNGKVLCGLNGGAGAAVMTPLGGCATSAKDEPLKKAFIMARTHTFGILRRPHTYNKLIEFVAKNRKMYKDEANRTIYWLYQYEIDPTERAGLEATKLTKCSETTMLLVKTLEEVKTPEKAEKSFEAARKLDDKVDPVPSDNEFLVDLRRYCSFHYHGWIDIPQLQAACAANVGQPICRVTPTTRIIVSQFSFDI